MQMPPALPTAKGSAQTATAGVSNSLAKLRFAIYGAHALRLVKGALYVIIPLVMLVAMAGGVLFVRLRHGPIAFDVLVPPLERGINAELTTNSVRIKGAELRMGQDGGFEFRLRNVSVLDADGDTVANAPLAAVSISTPALWHARIVPARIELIDPVINLQFTEEGGLTLSSVNDDAGDDRAASGKVPGRAPGADPQPAPQQGAVTQIVKSSTPHQISLVQMLSESSRRARSHLDATSYLTEFGVRNATVVLDYGGQVSSWQITEADVDFNHARRRSVISGRATVASPKGPWAFSFLTDETDKTDKVVVKATLRDLVPQTLAAAAPPLALLRMIEMPIAGDATVEITTAGEVGKAEIALEAGSGRIVIPDVKTAPFNLTAGLFRLSYDGQARQWDLGPSPVKWPDGNVLLSGVLKDVAGPKGPPHWSYALEGRNATLEASDFNVAPVTLEVLTANGEIVPRLGQVSVNDLIIKGGGGETRVKALTQAGPDGQSSRAEVSLSPMPLATLKALWPQALAPGARGWVGKHLTGGEFRGGSLKFANGRFYEGEAAAHGANGQRLSGTFEFADGTGVPLEGMMAVNAPRALIRLENTTLEVSVPEASATVSNNKKVTFKAIRLVSPDFDVERSSSELSFAVNSPLGPFLEVLETVPVKSVRAAAPFPRAADGKIDAQIKLSIPLVPDLDPDTVVFEGKAKVSDGRFGKVGGQFDVQGFTLNLDVTDKALDAKGDLLVNGVPAKISGQRILGAEQDKQPPFKVTATLDEADRTQLGLDVNDVVHGPIPIEISMQKGIRPEPTVRLKADLTNADLFIESLAWRKPSGRTAVLETDIAPGKVNKTELQNFKIAGDDIAVEGWIGIGADNKPREYYFPDFSLNVVSHLEVQGNRGTDDIWSVKVRGKTFDGRDLFRSLFAVGDGAERKSKKSSAGADINAEIDNVIGHSDVTLRALKLKMSSRGDKIVALDAKGSLDGTAPFAAVIENKPGTPRRLLADSTDAGQALKLIGFYPNMQGGRLKLEVNLDGKGAADKTGVLWTENFRVLGDPVVSEVVGSVQQGKGASASSRKVTREVFEFDRLRAPFSIGYGQFVLEESYVKGPMLGANLRGKVDFKTRRMDVGGTYIPLQGLNGVLGDIPLLGQILGGAHGEGIFGITFAVQGAMSDPQVIVNPLSLVAPGILREMFQMTDPNAQVQVREDKAPAKPVEERVRASSTPANAVSPKRATPPSRAAPANVDGWSSTTKPMQ
jgi:hypothetical protein